MAVVPLWGFPTMKKSGGLPCTSPISVTYLANVDIALTVYYRCGLSVGRLGLAYTGSLRDDSTLSAHTSAPASQGVQAGSGAAQRASGRRFSLKPAHRFTGARAAALPSFRRRRAELLEPVGERSPADGGEPVRGYPR